MRLSFLFTWFCLFVFTNLFCQVDTIFDLVNESEFIEAHHLAESVDNIILKKEILSYIEYEQNGYTLNNNYDREGYSEISDDQKVLRRLLRGHELYFGSGNEEAAKREYDNALEIAKRIKNTSLICASLRSLLRLFCYYDVHDGYVKHFENYLQQYSEFAKSDIDKSKQLLYKFRLTLRVSVQKSQQADKLYGLVNDLLRNSNDSLIKGNLFILNALYYVRQNRNADSAYHYFSIAKNLLRNSTSVEDKERYSACYTGLGALNIEEDNPKTGLKYLDSLKIDFRGFLRKYALVYHYYWKYEAYRIIDLKDSLIIAENQYLKMERLIDQEKSKSQIADLEEKYQTKEKENQILEEQQKVRTNRNWLIAATLALLLSTGIAILLHKNTSKKRLLAEQEAVLKQQKVENLLKEQELVSIDAMIAGQEKERQKVAGELHDDLGSLMATIKLHFDNAKINKKDPALQNAQKLLEEAYQKVRGMAHSKNSGVMSDQGLLPAIKKMAKTISETSVLEVIVEDFGMGERMENSLELSIFRMVQELVTNSIKHAEASRVNIQLTQHEDNLNIIVEDNGKGFDMSQVEKTSNGMGLTNIEKRVEHLEGNFTVDSIIGKGTSILIDIPV